MNAYVNGQPISERELIAMAIEQAGGPSRRDLSPGYIDEGLRLGYSYERIVAIACGREHLLPRDAAQLAALRIA